MERRILMRPIYKIGFYYVWRIRQLPHMYFISDSRKGGAIDYTYNKRQALIKADKYNRGEIHI